MSQPVGHVMGSGFIFPLIAAAKIKSGKCRQQEVKQSR
jgi:hypothetical protein